MAKSIPHPHSSRPAPRVAAAPPIWNRRGTVVAVVATVSLAAALAYSGPSAPVVLYRLLADGMILLAWITAATGLGCLGWTSWWAQEPEDDAGPLLGLVTAAALGLGILSLAILGLGLAGWLNRATGIGLLAIGIAAGGWRVAPHLHWRKQSVTGRPDRTDRIAGWWRGPAGWGWAWIAIVPFAAVALVGTMVPAGLLWKPAEPHGYDVVEYHLQVPREWYEGGRIVPLRHNVFSYFPFNVEMHYLLAMHLEGGAPGSAAAGPEGAYLPRAWESMFLAQLMHGTMIVLTVAAVCGFAGRLTPAPGGALVAGIATATVPWLSQLAAIAYNEGGFLLFSTLSVGWALWAILFPRQRGRHFILAGAMAGLAAGVKLTAVPEVLIGVPMVAGAILISNRIRDRRNPREGARGDSSPEPRDPIAAAPGRTVLLYLLAFAVAGLLLFAPWLARTWAWSGNPVFPEASGLLGRGSFSDVQVERWHRAHAPQPEQQGWLHFSRDPQTGSIQAAGRLAEGWRQIVADWQFGYVLLPMGLLSAILARRKPAAWFLGGMLLLLTGFWLGFTHLQGRFFLLAIPVCAMLAAQVSWGRWTGGLLAIILLAGVPGWIGLHRRIITELYGHDGRPGVVQGLGVQNVSWLTADILEGLPPGAPLLLVGDAQAYWYPMPMSRLRYRTVFDADTSGGRGVAQAYGLGKGPIGEWTLVNTVELSRFEGTYQPFPSSGAAFGKPAREPAPGFLLLSPKEDVAGMERE